MSKMIVVTRHPALVDLLRELGVVSGDVEVITHVTSPDQVRGRVVVGVLPMHLAALAKEVWVATLDLKPEDRSRELTLDELRAKFRGLRKYKVIDLGEVK